MGKNRHVIKSENVRTVIGEGNNHDASVPGTQQGAIEQAVSGCEASSVEAQRKEPKENAKITLVKLTLCGPADVAPEITAAQDIIYDWNRQHGESNGFWVKHQHWSTDSFPALGDRGQGIINRQLIADSDIVVAIFWSRFGTPTGVANSGTEEEIRRGHLLGKKILVYFSNIEPLPPSADTQQLNRLWEFRQELRTMGLCWTFNSRAEFRKSFANHLALVLNDLKPSILKAEVSPKADPQVQQIAKGSQNIQMHGSGNTININRQPPVEKTILERRPGSIDAEDEHLISSWIQELADGELKMPRSTAFGMWRKRFYNRFKISRTGDLPAVAMTAARGWYYQVRAIQKRGYKSPAPDMYRQERISAIKAAMNEMGATNGKYYPELGRRLKMKKSFASLKDLTTRNLDRVYRMVLRDKHE